MDPSTHQKQIVNRITTLVKPMSLWCPVDSSFMNPATVAATNKWQSAHGNEANECLSLVSERTRK